MSFKTFIYLLFFINMTFSSWAGIGMSYFKALGISCDQESLLNPALIASDEELINCFKNTNIIPQEIQNLYNSSKKPRFYLESWVYIQNASKKILYNAGARKVDFENLQKAISNKALNDKELQNWKGNFKILYGLYQQKSQLEKMKRDCSKWRVRSMLKRKTPLEQTNCNFTQSKDYNIELQNTILAIEGMEEQNPQFTSPRYNTFFTKLNHKTPNLDHSFLEITPQFLQDSLISLDEKITKFNRIKSQSLNKKNIDKIFDSPETLSEITTVNYSPSTKFLKTSDGYQAASLSNAECFIHQSLLGHNIDDLLKNLGKDAFLLLAPFSIKGKINAAFKIAKAAKKLIQIRKARGLLVLSEGAMASVDSIGLNSAKNKCQKLQAKTSTYIQIPKNYHQELQECNHLMDSLSTSFALAVLGGTTAVKLSKYDLIDIRKAKVFQKGKQFVIKSSSTVKATLVKHLDIVQEQFNDIISQISPQSAMAYNGPSPASNMYNQISSNMPNLNQSQGKSIPTVPNNHRISSTEEEINNLSCVVDKSCKTQVLYLTPGIKKLDELPDGEKASQQVLTFLKNQNISEIPKESLATITDCLKVKSGSTKCSPIQIETLFLALNQIDAKEISPYYLKQVLNLAKNSTDSEFLKRLGSNLASQKGAQKGIIHPHHEKLSIKDGEKFIGDLKTTEINPDRLSILNKESKAKDLLKSLGFDIRSVSESVDIRKQDGVDDLFNQLRKSDGLGKNKSADLILNNNFIVDIYTPASGVSNGKAKTIIEGVLKKSEGKHNQANRVVIYAEKVNGNPEEITKKLKEEVVRQKPEQLQEAFMILRGKNGEAELFQVWP